MKAASITCTLAGSESALCTLNDAMSLLRTTAVLTNSISSSSPRVIVWPSKLTIYLFILIRSCAKPTGLWDISQMWVRRFCSFYTTHKMLHSLEARHIVRQTLRRNISVLIRKTSFPYYGCINVLRASSLSRSSHSLCHASTSTSASDASNIPSAPLGCLGRSWLRIASVSLSGFTVFGFWLVNKKV